MFLKRLFKKKAPPPEPTVERLDLDGLRERLEKLKEERLGGTRARLNGLLEQLSTERGAVENELNLLSKADSTEQVHPGLYKSSLEARRVFVDKMSRSLVNVPPLKGVSTGALASLDERLTKMVNQTTAAVKTHGRYLRMVFGTNFKTIQVRLKQLHDLAREIHKLIKEATEKTKSLDAVLSKVEAQAGVRREIGVLEGEIKSARERVSELEKFVEGENAKMEQLVGSEEYKQVEELGRGIKEAERGIAQTKSAVTSSLSGLSRPLRKMKKEVTSGGQQMDRNLQRVLELCIRDPLAVVSSDEKVEAAETVARRLLEMLEGGEFKLSDRERSRRVEMAREVVEGRKLREFRERIERLQREREERLQAWEKLPHMRRSELERSIEKGRSDVRHTQEKVGELERKVESARQGIEKNRGELEREAGELLGVRVELG